MKNIKTKIRNYFRKSSTWKIAGDIIFYVLIILLIIPATRKPITATMIRITMRKPKIENTENLPKIAPEDKSLILQSLEGKTYSLDDFDSKIMLINFWATWCPPCRAEMPSLQKLYYDYADKINILLITSEDEEVVRQYLKEGNYDLPVYFQRSALGSSFNVNSIPTTFLIDKKGEILTEKTGAANWNSDSFRAQLDRLAAD